MPMTDPRHRHDEQDPADEVVYQDDDRLFSLINDKLRTIPGVRATETFIYVSLRKQTYTWGAH